ncbi:TonB-dependent receptor domain-containing protein [Taylorella equigenitalis]|uniref:TonB-dependent receptor domain-containing protein n=1 Tax=Taylorella equigenitalis TaxID=29575 RepID=UPI00040C5311|nr:TonB-dependent receptor [Taylorella equigenitalis]WDU53271.1 TonB-dependent receptor [Taylorella equigenitalis]
MRSTSLAVLLALLSLNLHAQALKTQTNKKTNSSDITKKNQSKISDITVIANLYDSDTQFYPGSVNVVKNPGLLSQSNIIDSIANVPGITTGGDYGRQIGNQFTVRGFGYQEEQRVIIQQDGVKRSANLFSNHISSFRTDNDILRNVDIVKGSSSILHGSGAIGGVVGMTTKDAHDFLRENKKFGFMLGQRYESNNMHSARAAAYADLGKIDFLLYGKRAKFGDVKFADGGTLQEGSSGQKVRNDTGYNDETIKTGLFKIGFDLTDEQRATFSIYDYKENLKTVWQTLWHNDKDLFIDGKLTQRDYIFDYSFKPKNIDWINLEAKIYKSNAEYYRKYDESDGNGEYSNTDKRKGFRIKNVAYFNTGSLEHTLVAGVDYQNRTEDAHFVRNGEVSDFGSHPASYKDWGLYVQDEMKFSRIGLTLGGRYDNYDRTIKKPGAEGYKASRFSPRVALSLNFTDNLAFLIGHAQSFRGPTPHETSSKGALNPHYHYIPNKNLKAETSSELEFGLALDQNALLTSNDRLKFKFMYFDGSIRDMISIKLLRELGKPKDASFYAQYQNVAKAKRHGFEASLDYSINDLTLRSSYEHLKLTNSKNGENLRSFADKLRVELTYDINPNFSIGFDVNHWFKPYQNPKTIESWGEIYTYVDKSFTIANLKGSWRLNHQKWIFDDVTLNFGVNNIFDKKYIPASSTNDSSFVGVGRNAYLDLELKF